MASDFGGIAFCRCAVPLGRLRSEFCNVGLKLLERRDEQRAAAKKQAEMMSLFTNPDPDAMMEFRRRLALSPTSDAPRGHRGYLEGETAVFMHELSLAPHARATDAFASNTIFVSLITLSSAARAP